MLSAVGGDSVFAAWPLDTHSGVPLCTATGEQTLPQIVTDGAGGAMVVWTDARSGTADLYAQHVNRLGDPLWAADGIAVCTASGAQTLPRVISDGAGGAIVAWQDARGANLDVYAQRIAADGSLLWSANGAAVCTALADQTAATLEADGAGGAIVAWVDSRTGFLQDDIYAQRLNAVGSPQWTANGIAICSAVNFQVEPKLVADGAGGAIVVWTDWRNTADIYAQRVNAAGTTLWAANGVPVCAETSVQNGPTAAADGAGGVFVAWTDSRTSAATLSDIYAQHISSAGAPLWALAGVSVCASTWAQLNPTVARDGIGGVDIAWEDQEVPGSSTIRYSHLDDGGNPWSSICGSNVTAGSKPQLVYHDTRTFVALQNACCSIFVSTMDPVGNRESFGTVCEALGNRSDPVITIDDNRGAIVAWQDQRSGQSDIYVERMDANATPGLSEPVITSVRDVAHDQGGLIKVSWLPPYFERIALLFLSEYRVWRAIPESYAMQQKRSGARLVEPDAVGTEVEPRRTIVQERAADTVVFWEYLGSVPISGNAGYSYVVPTIGDSVAGWNPPTLVRIQALGAPGVFGGDVYWNSLPDSGYSVDNLAPAQPVAFAGNYGSTATAMTWNANVEPDLAGYRLYRGTSPSFVPSEANRIGSPTQPHYTDEGGGSFVYKLSATDVHGNESPFTTLAPTGTIDVATPVRAEFFFAPPAPNPVRATEGVVFRFGLTTAATVRVAVYDLAGRLVRRVRSAPMAAGEHTLRWDSRDETRHRVAAGVYLVRLQAGDHAAQRRLVVIE